MAFLQDLTFSLELHILVALNTKVKPALEQSHRLTFVNAAYLGVPWLIGTPLSRPLFLRLPILSQKAEQLW